jgi:hypothetical protein
MRRVWLLVLACTAAQVRPVAAQRVAVDILTDAEVWETDAGSQLLARNRGVIAAEGRLRGWVVYRASRKIELLAHGMVEGGSAEAEPPEWYLEQLELRASPSQRLTIEAGKILQPIGAFGARRFSNTNPLIGTPDAYPSQYPWGGVATGRAGAFDYHVGVTSLPPVNTRYTPEPGHLLRPVGGLGMSVGPALRIGVTVTHGPYLSDEVTAQLPAGSSWKDYKQTVVASDLRWSVGYVEARAEVAWSSYDAPTVSDPLHGLGWYAELRGTVSPRLFLAGRFEHYRYPFILPINPSFWVGRETTQMNGEVGLGYRFTAATLLKTSVRRDHWPEHTIAGAPPFPDGYAVALQLSIYARAADLLR